MIVAEVLVQALFLICILSSLDTAVSGRNGFRVVVNLAKLDEFCCHRLIFVPNILHVPYHLIFTIHINEYRLAPSQCALLLRCRDDFAILWVDRRRCGRLSALDGWSARLRTLDFEFRLYLVSDEGGAWLPCAYLVVPLGLLAVAVTSVVALESVFIIRLLDLGDYERIPICYEGSASDCILPQHIPLLTAGDVRR